MKPVIIFDLDGTLADTGPDLLTSLNHCVTPYGLPPLSRQELGHLVGHGSLAMIQRAFALNNKDLNNEVEQDCQKRFLKFYKDHIADETKLFEGATELLDKLKTDGYPLAVCTNKQEHFAHQLVTELSVFEYFDAITGGDSFKFRKPDGRHLLETIKLAGGADNKAIMIGDTITDIDAAKNASIAVIAVDFGYCDVPINELKPDFIVSHFNEIFDLIKTVSV